MGAKKGRRKKNLTVGERLVKFHDNIILMSKSIEKSIESNVRMHRGIWGLDISSSNTGLSTYSFDNDHYEFNSYKFKGGFYDRVLNLEEAFKEKVYENPFLTVIEGYAYGRSQYRELMGETTYAVKACFLRLNRRSNYIFPSIIVPPQSVKKFVTGRSQKVEKREMLETIKSQWSLSVKNHDEADSAALCVIGVNILSMVRGYKKRKFNENYVKKFLREIAEDIGDFRMQVLESIIVGDGENVNRFNLS